MLPSDAKKTPEEGEDEDKDEEEEEVSPFPPRVTMTTLNDDPADQSEAAADGRFLKFNIGEAPSSPSTRASTPRTTWRANWSPTCPCPRPPSDLRGTLSSKPLSSPEGSIQRKKTESHKGHHTEWTGSDEEKGSERTGSEEEKGSERTGSDQEKGSEWTGSEQEKGSEWTGSDQGKGSEWTESDQETESEQTGSDQETESEQTGSDQETESEQTGSDQETKSERSGSEEETESERTDIEEETESERRTYKRETPFFRAALLNVNSMKKKTPKILKLITENQLDIFFSTETYLKWYNADRVLREASPLNFSSLRHVSEFTGRRGVAIQFSSVLHGEQIYFDNKKTFECVATVLQNEEWEEPVLSINLYRPSLKTIASFLNDFKELLNQVSQKYNNIIVTGDFNICVVCVWKPDVKQFLRLLSDNGFVWHPREPTYSRSHNILDLVLTKYVEVSDVKVWNDHISDHYTVQFNWRPVRRDERKKYDEDGKQIKKDETAWFYPSEREPYPGS